MNESRPSRSSAAGRGRIGIWSLAGLLLLHGFPAASAPPWHALGPASAPAAASLSVQSADANGLTLQAVFPGFRLASKRHPLAGAYLAPETPGCGVTEQVGAPALPALRKLIVAPRQADLRLTVTGAPRFFSLDSALQLFFPRQSPRAKSGATKPLAFDFDLSAYSANAYFPALPCRLREAGLSGGRRLVLVEVFPFAVNPVTLGLRLFPDLTIRIDFEDPRGVKLGAAWPDDADRGAYPPDSAIPPVRARTAAPAAPRLLVVAPDGWLAALDPLAAHRQARGWQVDRVGSGAAGTSADAIRAFIQARFNDPATRPDALLLVGDTPQIPCFSGVSSDQPDTDLYYACMDGGSDWLPEFPVGRLSAGSLEELGAILDKVLAHDTAASAPWMARATFLAGLDRHALTEGTHEAVIADRFDPLGYTSGRLYASRGAKSAHVSAALNDGRLLAVYSGHGDATGWSDGPPFDADDVLALTNRDRYPIVFSFSCLTGRFGRPVCFAETWQRAAGRGAAGMLASSVTSYWDEDDTLERLLFEAVFQDGVTSWGEAVRRAKLKLLEDYGPTFTIRRYFEQYNYFGDPAAVLRQPDLGFATSPDLPTARVGQAYETRLSALGGLEPFTWTAKTPPPPGLALDPASGRLAGVPLAAVTGHLFEVRLNDADGAATTRTFRIHVAAESLRITGGTNPPPLRVGAPFVHALDAAGGIAPYTWRLAEPNGRYTTRTNTGVWIATAPRHATGWKGDERNWRLRLPWGFPFYGQRHRTCWVHSNGYIDFAPGGISWENDADGLRRRPRLAPFWEDLRMTDIHVRITTRKAVIRWIGQRFTDAASVDFQAVLFRNGNVHFTYRPIRGLALAPTIGVSAGDGFSDTLSELDGAARIARRTRALFVWHPPLPPGLQIDPAGLLSGSPETAGLETVPILVEDQSVPPQQASAALTIRME